MSFDSTAKAAATALIEPKAPSRSFAEIPNCLIAAIAPSVVWVRFSKDGASSVLASADNATLVSSAVKPACAKVDATLAKLSLLTPKVVANLVISFSNDLNPIAPLPVTC